MLHVGTMIAHENNQQRTCVFEISQRNHFPAGIRQPEIRRLRAQRQHRGVYGNHAENVNRSTRLVESKLLSICCDLLPPSSFVWARKYPSKAGLNTPAGSGWDFSYNICVEPSTAGFDVFDGNARKDTYS